jgi:hypothetical protein
MLYYYDFFPFNQLTNRIANSKVRFYIKVGFLYDNIY